MKRLQLTPTERLQRHQMALELVEALHHVKKGPRTSVEYFSVE